MTLRNSNRSPAGQDSWRQYIISYRRARLQRSLNRLRTHPAVNPEGPHGPHGRLPSSPSAVSSCATHPRSHSSTPNPSQCTSPEPADHTPPGIIPALFNDLVHRELGIDPLNTQSSNSARLADYLRAARAVTSIPSLSDPRFVSRLATGNDPARLTDKALLSSLSPKCTGVTLQSQRVRDIHLAIQKARLKGIDAGARMEKAAASNDSPELRRSTRKRLRSQRQIVASPVERRKEKSDVQSGELAAFRPTPECVRRTRSEAARARRSSANKTPSECCFCPDPQKFDAEEIESELIGPFVDRRGNAKLFVHFDCACWAPQVYTDPSNGQLRRVYDEYCRGRKLKCSSCGEKGATIGCYIQRCKRVFHYRCLEPAKAYCVERFFAAFCETHAHLGRKPSYRILMEAATIADVSAAQRSEDTTYGLDAPHSRYTMLRRRETEIIFSRKWRISSHSGAFDTGKVVFSHRRKAALGRTDRLSVGDCVRVLRTSALDIGSGRLAFMALAQKGAANDDVTAVEARAAIASRESTGLLLLRNLRNARQWETGEIEVVRSIPMESKPAQASSTKRSDPGSEPQSKLQEHLNKPPEYVDARFSGKKRPGLQESEETELNPDRKRQKLLLDNGSRNDVASSSAELAHNAIPSAPLPSFDKSTTHAVSNGRRDAAHSLTQLASEKDAMKDPSGLAEKRSQQECETRSSKDVNPDVSSSLRAADTVPRKFTSHNGQSPKPSDLASPHGIGSECRKQEESEKQETESKVKSAWETFLEEQLPRERLLRPDDAMADSLRNMARLWSLMSPTQRNAYQRRGRISSVAPSERSNEANCTASAKTITDGSAGLFSVNQGSHLRTQSGLRLQLKRKEHSPKRQASVSLSAVKEARRGDRVKLTQSEQLNWDSLFPTTLESNLSRVGGSESPQCEGRVVSVDRVRAPPARTKTGS